MTFSLAAAACAFLSLGINAAPRADLPTVGSDKTDAWGQPFRTADKIALKRMLAERRFSDLTRVLEAFQGFSDGDCSKELWGLDAFEAFQSADPALAPLLSEWVAASPKAYPPLVARGHYWAAVAMARRGCGWASETTQAQWRGMADASGKAIADLEASVALHPTAAAYRQLANVGKMNSRPTAEWLGAALKLCPASVQIRAKLVTERTPRWGGSYEEMVALASDAPVAKNPKLKVLPGYVELDRASLARGSKDYQAALEANDRALKFGPYWEFQLDKAKTLVALARFPEALALVTQAIEQRPQKARAHGLKAKALGSLGRWKEAAEAMAYADALDPYDSNNGGMDKWTADGVLAAAEQLQGTDPAGALELVERALSLVPASERALGMREVLRGTSSKKPSGR